MKQRDTAIALAGISAAALLLVMAIGRMCIAQQRRRDADDLKRWEGEGGPPHPEDADGSIDAA